MPKKYINTYWGSKDYYTFYEYKRDYEAGLKEKNAQGQHNYKSCLEILPQIIRNTMLRVKKPHLFKDRFSNKKLYYDPKKYYRTGWFGNEETMNQYYIDLKQFHDDMPVGIKRLLNESKLKLKKLEKARSHIKNTRSKDKYTKKYQKIDKNVKKE